MRLLHPSDVVVSRQRDHCTALTFEAVDSGLLPYTPRTLPDYEHARDLGHGCDSTLRLQGDAVGDGSCTTCCADPADAEIGDPSTEMPASRTRRQPDRYFTQLPGLNLPATRSADHPSMRPTDVSFTPEAIASAKVIQQVDRKFVACVMQGVYPAPRPEGSRGSADSGGVQGKEVAVLVLVDQHAADERVSVEPMTEELCTGFVHDSVDTTSLSDIGVVLTQEECGMLQSEGVVDILHRWGIQLDLTQTGEGNNDYVQVGLSAVPTVLKARLGRKEGKEMTRLLKVYLPFLVENIGQIQALLKRYGPAAEKAGGQCVEMVDWTALIRWMPLEMVELVNSKACRSELTAAGAWHSGRRDKSVAQLTGQMPSCLATASQSTSASGSSVNWDRLDTRSYARTDVQPRCLCSFYPVARMVTGPGVSLTGKVGCRRILRQDEGVYYSLDRIGFVETLCIL